MKKYILILVVFLLGSCSEYKNVCYKIKYKHMTYSKGGIPYYYLYLQNDSISLEKSCDASTYYENNVGDKVCFKEQTNTREQIGMFFICFIFGFAITVSFILKYV